jgi:hypothetical protein
MKILSSCFTILLCVVAPLNAMQRSSSALSLINQGQNIQFLSGMQPCLNTALLADINQNLPDVVSLQTGKNCLWFAFVSVWPYFSLLKMGSNDLHDYYKNRNNFESYTLDAFLRNPKNSEAVKKALKKAKEKLPGLENFRFVNNTGCWTSASCAYDRVIQFHPPLVIYSHDEKVGIIAHEAEHGKQHHALKYVTSLFVSVALTEVIFRSLFYGAEYLGNYIPQRTIPLFLLQAVATDPHFKYMVAKGIWLAYKRRCEKSADIWWVDSFRISRGPNFSP